MNLSEAGAAIVSARLEFDIHADGLATWINGKHFFTADGYPISFRTDRGIVTVTVNAKPEAS